MQAISPKSLARLPTRIQYLKDFINFTTNDAATLHAAKPVVAPLIPAVVDAVYTTLLSFDITAKAFVPQQTGYTGEAPTKLEELGLEHPQINFRKDFLARYLVKLVTMDYNQDESWEYLDRVGFMHTGKAGFSEKPKKPTLRVEYMHCAILLGYVQDILINAVVTHPNLDTDTKNGITRAVNKILWIQNDLFARHYIVDADIDSTPKISLDLGPTLLAVLALVAVGAGYILHALF